MGPSGRHGTVPASSGVNGGYRATNRLMRFVLILGAVLTLISGTQLFVLTDHTAEFFAWTIAAGSSATVMGAFYWTACVLSFLSRLELKPLSLSAPRRRNRRHRAPRPCWHAPFWER